MNGGRPRFSVAEVHDEIQAEIQPLTDLYWDCKIDFFIKINAKIVAMNIKNLGIFLNIILCHSPDKIFALVNTYVNTFDHILHATLH